jgi:hypothetical protein
MDPGRFILICLAGWLNREQQEVIEYLREKGSASEAKPKPESIR